MKISPVAPQGATVGAVSAGGAVQPQIRSLRMNTNATPGRIVDPDPTAELPAATNQTPLPNSDVNDRPAEATNQPLSPQAAALARERRALQRQMREFEQEKRRHAEQQQSTQGAAVPLETLKANPLGVLLENGVTYDQLTQAVLQSQNGNTPEIIALKTRIKELESGFEKKLTDRDAQAEQEALTAMRQEASRLVSDGEDFALIRETRSVPLVIDLIKRTHEKTGELLDVQDACRLLEEQLIDETLKAAKLNKLQAKMTPSAAQPQPQQSQGMRTLSNRDTARPVMDRRQRALMAFRGELNK